MQFTTIKQNLLISFPTTISYRDLFNVICFWSNSLSRQMWIDFFSLLAI